MRAILTNKSTEEELKNAGMAADVYCSEGEEFYRQSGDLYSPASPAYKQML